MKLTQEQVDQLKPRIRELRLTPDVVCYHTRFFLNSGNLNIRTGEVLPRGTNVIYQMVYWDMPREISKQIEEWLGVTSILEKSEKPLTTATP